MKVLYLGSNEKKMQEKNKARARLKQDMLKGSRK